MSEVKKNAEKPRKGIIQSLPLRHLNSILHEPSLETMQCLTGGKVCKLYRKAHSLEESTTTCGRLLDADGAVSPHNA